MAVKRVSIQGYLTQAKLENTLHEIVGDTWVGSELVVPGSRRRWDMAFSTNGRTTVVEYDGDEHYCNSLKIKTDVEKDRVAAQKGYRVVRIPYWVQLTNQTLHYYFGIDAEIEQDFPHGFITTKIFPASFCSLGLQRFAGEMNALPADVRDAVMVSLRERAKEHGDEYVMPRWPV